VKIEPRSGTIPARELIFVTVPVRIPSGGWYFSQMQGRALMGAGNPHPIAIPTGKSSNVKVTYINQCD